MASNTTAYNREYYAKRKESVLRAQAKYRSSAKAKLKRRASDLLRKYGITLDQYLIMLEMQAGGCAVCGSPPTVERGGVLHVDHDHVTGEVRGLLCLYCNILLGQARDRVGILKKAIEYLEK